MLIAYGNSGNNKGESKKKLWEILNRNKQMSEVYKNRKNILDQDVQVL